MSNMQMSRPLRRSFLCATTLSGLALLLLGACGGGEETAPTGSPPGAPSLPELQPQPEPVQPLAPAVTEPQDGALAVAARDAQFAPNNLRVPAGAAVTIRVTNNDAQPHNLRLAGPDGRYETEDDAVTEPDTIGGGAAGELTFAPLVAGAYTFRCDFHPGSMGGRIAVQ